jgi:hypothetical protein
MTMPDLADSHLHSLFALFPPENYLRSFEVVSANDMPAAYRKLLAHEHHMTVTVEAHHGGPVDVNVLEVKRRDDFYARKILLALQKDAHIVQFGLVRVDFRYCNDKVKQEILSEAIPLGRVLINNNVLRRIEPTHYLRITPGPDMMKWFGLGEPKTTYGRLAVIHCDHQPAVELLEIVAPE